MPSLLKQGGCTSVPFAFTPRMTADRIFELSVSTYIPTLDKSPEE